VDLDGAAHASIEVEAKVVVLAAGAVASPDLLQRSGLGGEAVGRHLHTHPSVMAAGFFDDEIHAYRGIPQSYYIDEFIDLEVDPHRGYVLMPIAGFPVLTATQLPGFGRENFRWMKRFSRMAGLLVLLHDRSEGRVRPGGSLSRPKIDYHLDDDDAGQLAQGLVHSTHVLFAGGARRVVIPFAPEPLVLERGDDPREILRRGVRQGFIPMASTHPQSTCRMAANASDGVVNEWGEVFGSAGLFVADMSVFPTSLGAPPQITTAALADRTANHIVSRRSELLA
jgi:choline dehydrogenase-like flavoprotein